MDNTVLIPVSDKNIIKFCQFMQYNLIRIDGDISYFRIPRSHICRLFVNAKQWQDGKFDLDWFLESICDAGLP